MVRQRMQGLISFLYYGRIIFHHINVQVQNSEANFIPLLRLSNIPPYKCTAPPPLFLNPFIY